MSGTEIIEGEAVEVIEPRELIVAPQAHVLSGVGAIASIDDATFTRNLALIRKGVERARQMQEALLDEGTDYGTVPNVKRPFLHKPGAEKFEKAYGLASRFVVERLVGDGVDTPPLSFLAHSFVHLGDHNGPIVGEGIGEANSWETKYRYRNADRTCPDCGKAAIRKGKKRGTDIDEFYCWRKKDGCGATFEMNDPRLAIAEQVDNPDPWDLANTLVKMAKKRAYVDGILTTTGTSGLFTQDEDSPAAGAPASSQAPAASSGPTYVSQGRKTFTGTVARGDGHFNQATYAIEQDGHWIGFRLDLGGRSAIHEVICGGAIGEAMFITVPVEELMGAEVTVEGEAFRIDQPERQPRSRLVVSAIKGRDFTIPAAGSSPSAAPVSVAPGASQASDLDTLEW